MIFRERKWGERETDIDVRKIDKLPLAHAPAADGTRNEAWAQPGTQTHNLLLVHRMPLQPTEPHRPGLNLPFN